MASDQRKKTAKLLVIAAAAAASAWSAAPGRAAVITQWSFGTASGTSVPAPDNSPAPSTGSGTANSLGFTNNYQYTGGPTPTLGGTVSTTSDDVLSSPGVANPSFNEQTWRVRGTYNPGSYPSSTSAQQKNVNGWSNNAPQYSQGAEFDVPTTNYQNLQFSFDWYSTNQGIRDLQVQYNLNVNNAGGWTAVGGTTSTKTYIATPNDFYTGTATGTPSISLDLSSITGANNDPTFGLRLVSAYDSTGNISGSYASATLASGVTQAYNNNSGNWRFDNITISGTATPEPASLGLLSLGALGLMRRRRAR